MDYTIGIFLQFGMEIKLALLFIKSVPHPPCSLYLASCNLIVSQAKWESQGQPFWRWIRLWQGSWIPLLWRTSIGLSQSGKSVMSIFKSKDPASKEIISLFFFLLYKCLSPKRFLNFWNTPFISLKKSCKSQNSQTIHS